MRDRTHKRHPVPAKRLRRQTIALAVAALGLMTVVVAVTVDALHTDEPMEIIEERILTSAAPVHIITAPEATAPPEPISAPLSEDVVLLAKIMQEEDGVGWPNMIIMALGEVVLNRVASPEYPDTIREVLYQVDDGYIQYAPVHTPTWEAIKPEARYIELAQRLLDGERVLENPQIIYQALFEQGRGTVMSYTDFALDTTTYFCLTDSPELYDG